VPLGVAKPADRFRSRATVTNRIESSRAKSHSEPHNTVPLRSSAAHYNGLAISGACSKTSEATGLRTALELRSGELPRSRKVGCRHAPSDGGVMAYPFNAGR
jgi:hypothetical protein